ncbi:MAG TPA: DNA-directed RNA polymerase subunit omega [Fimbriimonadaceae bacterium]|nr:DNA-directed RNA polymerase subunit omega [Fimbriimonadaceae bacterium]
MLPSPDRLNDFQLGKFVLSNLAAKRAKQLREGAPPLIQVDSNHPLTIALAEIAAGKIRPILPSGDVEAVAAVDLPVIVDESELGMLLPALDETEAALVQTVAEEDHEHEHEHEAEEPDALSLSDLVEGDEEEAPVVAGEEDTLSLSDIAEQETTLEDEEPEA